MVIKPQLEEGYTRIANQILEALSKINLTSYQSRVLYAIFRKTYGFQKKEDWVSITQLVELTGLRQPHVSRTKKELLQRNLITSRGIKIGFQKDATLWCDINIPSKVYTNPGISHTSAGIKNIPIQDKNIPHQGHTKETIQKKLKETNTKERAYSSLYDIDDMVMEDIAAKYKVPFSFVRSKLDDMTNWMQAKGKVYRNYKAALSNWVKEDAIKISDRERRINSKNTFKQL